LTKDASKMEARAGSGLPVEPIEPIEALEADMLKMDQVDCPVIHRFSPGLYIREVSIPAGTLAIGHFQKTEHLNIFLQGRVLIMGDNGKARELAAPMIFAGKPGRKFGYIKEDVVWLNVYPTDETDIDTLEEMYLDKSVAWKKLKGKENRGIEEILNLSTG